MLTIWTLPNVHLIFPAWHCVAYAFRFEKVSKNSFFSLDKIICCPVEEDLSGCHLIILLKFPLDDGKRLWMRLWITWVFFWGLLGRAYVALFTDLCKEALLLNGVGKVEVEGLWFDVIAGLSDNVGDWAKGVMLATFCIFLWRSFCRYFLYAVGSCFKFECCNRLHSLFAFFCLIFSDKISTSQNLLKVCLFLDVPWWFLWS